MSSPLPDISDNNQQIVNDIQSLQQLEQQMFSRMENNPNLPQEQKEKIIQKIQKISDMRMNLYQTMGGVNQFFKNALLSSQGTLKQQTIAIEMIESQLNESRKKLKMLEAERNNKLRMTEINTYYGHRYAEHALMMKIIVITLIPIIILAVLYNKGILPKIVYYVLIGIIAAIGGYFFWNVFVSIIHRDNMDYQQYDWYFDPSGSSTSSGDASSDNPWVSDIGGCTNSDCCADGTSYDADEDQCIADSFTTLEAMANNELTKTSHTNRYKSQNNSNFRPKNTESFLNFKI
jgi:hypothetical protein